MKNLFFLFFTISLTIAGYASNPAQVIQNLSQYNCKTTPVASDKLSILKKLGGDTISFEFPSELIHLTNFTKEIPDTIWIKKRPKKNPVENKHYTLSYLYKGTWSGDRFTTPASEINGKKFGVLSINSDSEDTGSYPIFKANLIFKLVDLEDLSIVECIIPEDMSYDVVIYSDKVDRLLESLKGCKVYINTGSSYSPKYVPATLSEGSYKLLFEYSRRIKCLESVLDLEFVAESGERVPFTFDNNDYSHNSYSDTSSDTKSIISEDEYNSDFTIRTITSDIDSAIINSSIKAPFDFTYIIGIAKNSICHISQTIDPTTAKSRSWAQNFQYAPEDAMFVAGTETVKGVRFYKMAYNGKAFYMKSDDVELSSENSSKLDSLYNSSDEVKNYFFHHALVLSDAIYLQKLNNTITELESYKKYGLAIESWGVYDESEYTDGTGVNITFYNPTQQTIKYISFSLQGYNSVDDPYGRTITKRCIGPIEPDESASYKFEYTWFTDIVEYAKLRSITVTYKNGTKKTISNPQSIVFSNKLRKELNRTNPVENFN